PAMSLAVLAFGDSADKDGPSAEVILERQDSSTPRCLGNFATCSNNADCCSQFCRTITLMNMNFRHCLRAAPSSTTPTGAN
ncbi:hypothetical protein, partial [Pseudoalteromonas sp. BMB]|uniref:hypothetical protein n=1 Tax=Pseudoalteromonas sp. BMB TaxID=1874619 RepID=UPI001C3059AD